jgi:hypothetical protein
MVDFTSTQARANGVAPSASPEGGQTEVAASKPPSTSPLLTTDMVDKMYLQLAEIHAIAVTQLAECVHWRQSNSTPSPVWAGASPQRPAALRLAPLPPTDFSS